MSDARVAWRRRGRALALRASPALRRLEAERDELRDQLRAAGAAQRRLQDELTQARGAAVVAGPPIRDDLGYLFVITYGRSGSTLLQGILNSIPGYLIRGENRSSLFRLFQFQNQLTNAKRTWSKGRTLQARDAWFGVDEFDSDTALAGLRALVVATLLRPQPDTRVIGFKEIRWWNDDWRNYLDFLRAMFPGARFIINVRDHAAVARSKWWAENPDAFARLEHYEAQLDQMAAYLDGSVYRVNFDDFVADHEVLAGLFEWLGEPFDRARVDATMAVKHSS